MRRSLLVLVAALALAGCKSGTTNNVVDPFVGRTKVEPPRTGWITGQTPADPYYPDQSRAAGQSTPASQTSTSPAASADRWTVPAGGQPSSPSGVHRAPAFEANRSSIRIPTPVVGAGVGDRYPDFSASVGPPQSGPWPSADPGHPSAIRAAATSSAVAAAGSPAPWSDPARPTASMAAAQKAPAAGEGVIRIVEPRGAPAKVASWGTSAGTRGAVAAAEPRRIDPHFSDGARPIGTGLGSQGVSSTADGTRRPGEPVQSIDIMDLPTTRRGTPIGSRQQPSDAGGVRLASATSQPGDRHSNPQPTPAAGPQPAALLSSHARYGYDPQYQWLRGKLEYSQIDRRWKLRYIPIDGATDQFGGSVVLSDKTLLAGCERGDFVEVRGRLGQRPKDDHDYSPVYEVAEINRSAG